MIRQERRDDDRGGRSVREQEQAPDLDEAGGIHRRELDPQRSGSRPVEQNDRTRDRQLEEEPPMP